MDTCRFVVYASGYRCMLVTMEEPRERSIREVREHLADVVNDAVQGRGTWITSRGRRVAAVVPVTEVTVSREDAPLPQQPDTKEASL